MAPIRALFVTEVRSMVRDPSAFGILLGMPLIMIALVHGIFSAGLAPDGETGASQEDLAVPGFATMFLFFLVTWIIYSFFREHGWGTWARLRASGIRAWEVVLGKLFPYILVGALQYAFLFVLGGLFVGLDVTGSLVALVLVSLAMIAFVVAFGFVLVAISNSHLQANMLGNLSAILLAALGGALAPLEALPDWAQRISPAVPHYWAMKGFRSVVLESGGVGDVAEPVAVLLAMTAALLLLSFWRFRYEQVKSFAHT